MKVFFQAAAVCSVTAGSDVLSGGEMFATDAATAMDLPESVMLRDRHFASVLNSSSFWSKEILFN